MADLSDLLVKIAQNKNLTPSELADLGRFGRETQSRNAFVGGNTTAHGSLAVPTPFFPIYSEVLQADTASITIPIPTGYKHLMLMGSGRTTNAGTSSKFIYGRINADSAANYAYEIIYAQAASLSSTESTAVSNGLFVGILNDADQTAGQPGSFFTTIPHYQSNFFKTSLSSTGWMIGAQYGAHFISSVWRNTAKIETLRLIPAAGSFASGSAVSLYGIQ